MQNLSYSSLTLENIAQIADISEASGIWQPARRELAETDGWQIKRISYGYDINEVQKLVALCGNFLVPCGLRQSDVYSV